MRVATLGSYAAVLSIGLVAVAHPVWSETPGAGRFLIADREMVDPNFEKTVVLLIEYGEAGALGLVVNRPSDLKLSALSSEIEGLRNRQDPVFIGGPVPGKRISVLIRGELPPDGESRPVVEDVHFSTDDGILDSLTRMVGTEFRVYAGHAGWAPQQLDAEILRGAWHVVPAGADWIFSPHPAEMWDRLIPPEASRQARLQMRRSRCSASP